MKSRTDHGRGTIRDNHMAALVTSPIFRSKTEKPGKGKGSFKRNSKHKSREFRL